MKQHPVPQQISSYQFRLVGDMTLKQFFQLAGGFLVALLVYATNLPVIIKYPLILIFVLLGIALAFLPFKERPLSAWIVSFFRTIYSPTEFVWTRYETPPKFFAEDEILEKEVSLTTDKDKEISKNPVLANLESTERVLLGQISQLLHGSSSTPQPDIKQKGGVDSEDKKGADTQIPENIPAPVPKSPKIVVDNEELIEPEEKKDLETQKVEATFTKTQEKESHEAEFSPEAAPPMPPETPNTIVGQAMKPDGKIMEGAIMEIKDVSGRPVRALKTNALGHFRTVTQLPNGRYTINTEKDGYEFDDYMFEAAGEIIPPIAIRAKEKVGD